VSDICSPFQSTACYHLAFGSVELPMTAIGEFEPLPGIASERLNWSDSAAGKIVAIGLGMAHFGRGPCPSISGRNRLQTICSDKPRV
jgi:hypothetical protein